MLVVDDNVDAADALALLLALDGHDVRTAYSGHDAIADAAAFAPQAVFCDLGMPGLDGTHVAARLRADRRHDGAGLVALTGWGAPEDIERSRRSGFDHHLVKPAPAAEIAAILAPL